MGAEAFQVELLGDETIPSKADAWVRGLPGVRPDEDALQTSGSTYYAVRDGKHVLEVEVTESDARVSCRFAVCHPRSVDDVMMRFVRDGTAALNSVAVVSADPEGRRFSADELADFAVVYAKHVAEERRLWALMFGTEQLGVSTREAFERLILPHCTPVRPMPINANALDAAPSRE